jgi:hypothetical protein
MCRADRAVARTGAANIRYLMRPARDGASLAAECRRRAATDAGGPGRRSGALNGGRDDFVRNPYLAGGSAHSLADDGGPL